MMFCRRASCLRYGQHCKWRWHGCFHPVFSFRTKACFATLSLGFVIACGAVSAAPAAKPKREAAPTHNEVVEKKGDLKEIRQQIETLRQEVSTAEGQRASAADELKEVDQAISVTQGEIFKLAAQKKQVQETLKNLGQEARDLENRQESQQKQLEKLIYRQYLQGQPDALQLMLNGNDPNQVARDLYYLSAIGKARSQLVQEIENTLQRKQALTTTTRERADELAGIEARQKQQHGKLLTQREQRKLVLSRISAKIADQRREIGNLQRDEKQLSQLIDRLSKIIAARQVKPRPAKVAAGKASPPETGRQAAPGVPLAQMKGGLRLPVQGVVSNRFGAPRQEGGRWKGVFIRAATGSEVRAVAAGRVVFSEWMRGFGNLMIVDHGNNYLSIYGNNEALLKQVGDLLRAGETIASVGNSGGNPESGLYFELRYNGQPVDPLSGIKS